MGTLRRTAPRLHCVLVAAAVANATEPAPVRVVSEAATVTIDNGLVQARFVTVDGRITQAFLARRGDEWVPAAEGFSVPAGGEAATAAPARLYDTSIDPGHRILAPDALRTVTVTARGADLARVVLSGTSGTTAVEETVEIRPGERYVHVEVKAVLAGRPPRLEYLLMPFVVAIEGGPDVTYAPTYLPGATAVIGDRVFQGPAVCLQKDGLFVGLVPDLDMIDRHAVFARGARQHDANSFPVAVDPAAVTMPTALDLRLPTAATGRPVVSYGMLDSIVHQHVWFEHADAPGTMVRELSAHEVRIGLDLLLVADAPPFRGYQAAARHLWNRFGSPAFRRPRPQALPYAEYARTCYPAQFDYQGYEVAGQRLVHRRGRPEARGWQEWEVDERRVGGLRLHAPQWSHLIANLGWWNNVCDATGLHAWGTRLGNDEWIDKARCMVNLALSAPQDEGLFPCLHDLTTRTWIRSLWKLPRDGYDPRRADRFMAWDEGASYHAGSMSVTAGYLLQYRRRCEDDPRILPFVRRYGDFLVAAMRPDGCVPAWFDAERRPLPSLTWNAEGGAHAWVLSELFLATRDPRYLEAARRAAGFLRTEVMPKGRWVDFESLYSCAVKPETFLDERTGQGPCNTMALSWALQGFLSLHEATGDREDLDAAGAVADFASLFQAAWAPHYVITAYPFGGICSQVGDAEWLDQRAHRFADPLVRTGLLTGRQDLVERGIAVARSSLTLTNLPGHRANGIYVHTDFPEGLGPENVDHEGYPQRPLGSGPSWSSVGGLAGVAHVVEHLGGGYVDVEKGLAVGADGIVITSCERRGTTLRLGIGNQLAALPVPFADEFTTELRIAGLPAGTFDLVVNDRPHGKVTGGRLVRLPVTVAPDGGVVVEQADRR